MIKKVVIAAAGQGTRMMELTNDKSKHLIEVENKPFLFYLLDNLFRAGYEEIILVVGFKAELMEQFSKKFTEEYFIATHEKRDIKIINQFEILGPKEKEYGTACPLKCVKDLIAEPFLFICGDNLYSVDDLKAMGQDDNYIYVAGLENEHPEKYGVLIHNGEFLKEIIEKPEEFVGNLINAGLYKFTPDVFGKLPLITKSPRGEYEVTDVISLLAKDGKVKIKKIKDEWIDFGNPNDIKLFSNFLKNGGYQKISKSGT